MQNAEAVIKIRGMICRACTDSIESALLAVRGVASAKASYIKGSCRVEYDPALADENELCEAVKNAGYDTGEKGVGEYLVDIICVALTVLLVWAMMSMKLNAVPEAYDGAPLWYIFVIGLLTGTHCIAMCGGILLSQSTGGSALAASACYNGGRVVSYTVMGAVFGALGMVITYTMQTKSLVFTMVGILVAIIGINMWGAASGAARSYAAAELVLLGDGGEKTPCRKTAHCGATHRRYALRLDVCNVAVCNVLWQHGQGSAHNARIFPRHRAAHAAFRFTRIAHTEKVA